MALTEEQKRKLAEKAGKAVTENNVSKQSVFEPSEKNVWFMMDADDTLGPFTDYDMIEFINNGIVQRATMVQKNSDPWKRVYQTELLSCFGDADAKVRKHVTPITKEETSQSSNKDWATIQTWRFVTGIISIVFFLWVLFQVFVVGLVNVFSANVLDTSAGGGLFLSLFMLTAGIVCCATRKSKSKGPYIATHILYGLACVIGFRNLGIFSDLLIWSIWCAVCMLISQIGHGKANSFRTFGIWSLLSADMSLIGYVLLTGVVVNSINNGIIVPIEEIVIMAGLGILGVIFAVIAFVRKERKKSFPLGFGLAVGIFVVAYGGFICSGYFKTKPMDYSTANDGQTMSEEKAVDNSVKDDSASDKPAEVDGLFTPETNGTNGTNAAEETSGQAPEVVASEVSDEPQYEVTNTIFKVYKAELLDGYRYDALVEVKNVGSKNIYIKDAQFDIEDADGHLIQTDTMISDCPDVILPGECGYLYNSFGSSMESVTDPDSVRLSPHYTVKTTDKTPHVFPVSDTSVKDDMFGKTVVGRLTNDTDEEVSYIYVNVLYYNSAGECVGVGGTSVTSVAAGDTKSFEISGIGAPNGYGDDLADYKVIATEMFFGW